MVKSIREGFFYKGKLQGFGRVIDAFDGHVFVGYFDADPDEFYGVDT